MPGSWVLIPRLPETAWRVLAADAASAVGTGLTLPFLLVYLHSARGMGLAVAGAVAATIGVASLVGNPFGGWLADRSGPKSALVAGLSAAVLGACCWAVADSVPWAFTAAALSGLGVSICLPAQASLLACLVQPRQRSSVFAVGNGTLNVGLAAGGLLAALIVDAANPGTFVLLYLLDAASFAIALGMVLTVRTPSRPADPADRQPGPGAAAPGGFRTVLRDRAMIGVLLLAAFLSTAGFGQFNSALPVLATEHGGLAAGQLGLVFAANTAAVVLAQLLVLRLLAGRGRSRSAAMIGPLWALCWCLVLAAVVLADAATGVLVLFVVAAVVFGIGETLLWPTLPAVVNDLAPAPLRGRYNGTFSLALTTGLVAGPALAGLALAHGQPQALLLVSVAVCLGCGAAARGLGRLLPAQADLVPVPEPVIPARVPEPVAVTEART